MRNDCRYDLRTYVVCSNIQWRVMCSFSVECCSYWASWCSWESTTVFLILIRSSLDLCSSSLNSLKKDKFRMFICLISLLCGNCFLSVKYKNAFTLWVLNGHFVNILSRRWFFHWKQLEGKLILSMLVKWIRSTCSRPAIILSGAYSEACVLLLVIHLFICLCLCFILCQN
jgi:hypothetical protein